MVFGIDISAYTIGCSCSCICVQGHIMCIHTHTHTHKCTSMDTCFHTCTHTHTYHIVQNIRGTGKTFAVRSPCEYSRKNFRGCIKNFLILVIVLENSWTKHSQFKIKLRNPQTFCPSHVLFYTVAIPTRMHTYAYTNIHTCSHACPLCNNCRLSGNNAIARCIASHLWLFTYDYEIAS